MNNGDSIVQNPTWEAPLAHGSLDATVMIPGSKSLSNRFLILAALSATRTRIEGLLCSRDTELMMEALTKLGVTIETDPADATTVHIAPPIDGVFNGNVTIDCGLAGTVMRFVPGLALFADGPVHFVGDPQAEKRPMGPLLEGLAQLGVGVTFEGAEGFLPFTVTPPTVAVSNADVSIDSSGSSQFISGLLLIGSRLRTGLRLHHTGAALPSLPHILMTTADVRAAGGSIERLDTVTWSVAPKSLDLPRSVTVEPDLSNAAPFLEAALLAGGTVRVPRWPDKTTQPGALLPGILERFGARAAIEGDNGNRELVVTSSGVLSEVPSLDLSAAGELAPSVAALAVFSPGTTTLTGIAHLRGHETNRLEALVTQINRIGGHARELDDGVEIGGVEEASFHPTQMQTYADHRMATFAALVGLRVEGIVVEDIATTRKTLPDFVGMWSAMLAGKN